MRHLYASSSQPGMSAVIDRAKGYERRRCGHRPETHPEPLSTKECLSSVVDPKDNKTNKNRYVVASQDQEVRKLMRGIAGVPLIYINRSVMIMEPMASVTADIRQREEKIKFREGLKRGSGSVGMKRKREDEDEDGAARENDTVGEDGKEKEKKKKKQRGPKGPNPLSVKKSKKKAGAESEPKDEQNNATTESKTDDSEPGAKRKRRRKHKGSANAEGGADESAGGDENTGDVGDDE